MSNEDYLKEENSNNLFFPLSRLVLGIFAATLAFFLYTEYFHFLMNTGFSILYKLLVFNFGQLISLILLLWAGVIICKKMTCPKCRSGQLIFPLSELYKCLPVLPFSYSVLANFVLSKKESLFLKDRSGKLAGNCQCCGAEYYYVNNRLELRHQTGNRHD